MSDTGTVFLSPTADGLGPRLGAEGQGFLGPGSLLVAPSGAPAGSGTLAFGEPPLALGLRFPGLSGDPLIDAELFDGRAWDSPLLTYGFPDRASLYESPYGAFNEPTQPGFGQVSARQMSVIRSLLEGGPAGPCLSGYGAIASFTQLGFQFDPTGQADLRIAQAGVRIAPAWTYLPSANPAGGDIWFVTGVPGYDFRDPVLGDYFHFGHLHEVLHALGLKDASFAHATGAGSPATPPLPSAWDSLEFSAASYRSFVGDPMLGYRNETFGFPQTPMMLDIAALQHLYGADFTTQAGDSVYRWDPATGEMTIDGLGQGRPGANRIFLTVWDGGGTDTYDLSNYATALRIDLAPGGWSLLSTAQLAVLNAHPAPEAPDVVLARGNVFNALTWHGDPRSLIENAIGGSGDDTIAGNAADNRLAGGAGADQLLGDAGADTLDGGAGADAVAGGPGDDTYGVDTQGDLIFESDGGGRDTAIASVGFYLYAWVESLVLAPGAGAIFGSGNGQDNVIIGNESGNPLYGWGGNDTLQGGEGIDILFGLVDDDLLQGEDGNDVMLGGPGQDTLQGGAQSDALYGEEGDDSLVGGAGTAFDLLVGGVGNDNLDGVGGAVADVDYLYGGAGNDLHRVDSPADLAIEFAGEGNDTVEADIAGSGYYLYQEIEDLRLLGTTHFGVGNGLANRITGNAAANLLIAGAGDDTIEGGAGNDVLYGQAGADVFVVLHGTGTDSIADFTPGTDRIRLLGTAVSGFRQLLDLATDVGGTSAIDLGFGDVLILQGVAKAALAPADLAFV